ncbi:MAG: DegT/DnrJ/EryC1/StrS family aminotransferase [Syntrophothermus sp.]|nr:DegT/DnrJ/EryC1/StrS family aminotransferase [Syntrophothermus sp.]
MVMQNCFSKYEDGYERFLESNGSVFFFWKGRVAIYVLLKAIGVGSGDEVILPGFTCVVVPNAVLYLGAKPVYADIDPQTYNITAETIEPLISPRTKVIIAQNTFGLSPDLDPIMALAEQHGIYVIEDCAHGLGSTYKGRPAGTSTHASFFSTQWSKPISTGLGGIAYVRDEVLVHKVAAIVEQLTPPRMMEQAILAAQVFVRPLANRPALYYPLVEAYRFLTQKVGLSVGSSVGDELLSVQMPHGYLKRMGGFQRRALQRGLKTLPQRVRQRQLVAEQYDTFFRNTAIQPSARPDYAEHSMLRYPIRVPDKAKILERARRLRIPVGDWFVSPLHPVEGELSQWGYQAGQCPEAEKACAEVINLFTDHALSHQQLSALFDGML